MNTWKFAARQLRCEPIEKRLCSHTSTTRPGNGVIRHCRTHAKGSGAFVRQDAVDALGLAITHAHVGTAAQRLALAAGAGAKAGGKAGSGYRDGRSR